MEKQIDTLLTAISDDYRQWITGCKFNDIDIKAQEFRDQLSVSHGKKYIKIMKESSVWAFIVATDTDAKFKKGDILKAASYKAPTRNHARGNILTGNYSVKWTGAEYCGSNGQAHNEAVKAMTDPVDELTAI